MRAIGILSFTVVLASLTAAQTTRPTSRAIDECGILVQGAECALFQGAGGRYYIPDTGRFRVGDAVRVVGTLDPACVTICQEGDGCVRGAVLYDPVALPCGTPVNVQLDPCSGVSGLLAGLAVTGVAIASAGRHRRR
ncbi:MAG: hypothetical protein U1D55_04360 [Phycisphaerae bacterium]